MYLVVLAGSRVPAKHFFLFLALVAGLLSIMAASALVVPCITCIGGFLATVAGAAMITAKFAVVAGAILAIVHYGNKSPVGPQWS